MIKVHATLGQLCTRGAPEAEATFAFFCTSSSDMNMFVSTRTINFFIFSGDVDSPTSFKSDYLYVTFFSSV